MLAPWFRGLIERATGIDVIPDDVKHRRDLDTLADMLQYLRAETAAGQDRSTAVTRCLPRRAHIFSARAGRAGSGSLLRCRSGPPGQPVSPPTSALLPSTPVMDMIDMGRS